MSSSPHLSPELTNPLSAGSKSYETATRPMFYVGYYLLCCIFAAEPFAIILTLPAFALCCFNISRIRSNCAKLEDMIRFVTYVRFAIAPWQPLRLGCFQAILTRLLCNRTAPLFNPGAAVLVR